MKKLIVGIFLALCVYAFGETFQSTRRCTTCGREYVAGQTECSNYITMYDGMEEYTVAKTCIDEKKGIVITPMGKWIYYEDQGIVAVERSTNFYNTPEKITPTEFEALAVEVAAYIKDCKRECEHSHKLKGVKY